MKSILLYANQDDGLEARLQTALDLARAFGGHITCLAVTPYDAFILGDPFGGIYSLPVMVDGLREAEEAHRAKMEERLRGEDVAWDWVHRDGQAAQMIVNAARLADIVVISQPQRDWRTDAGPVSLADAVAVNARAPVLAVPDASRGFDCEGVMMVAWNGSDEAAHALRASLPLLATARAVQVVTVTEEDIPHLPPLDACHYLARHGIKSELREWPRGEKGIGASLIDAALDIGASALVTGAYGRSRVMEAVLGGTTRHILDNAPMPLILAH